MSKSFKQISDNNYNKKQFRIVEVEKGRLVKRTFSNTDTLYKETQLSYENEKALDQLHDLPF